MEDRLFAYLDWLRQRPSGSTLANLHSRSVRDCGVRKRPIPKISPEAKRPASGPVLLPSFLSSSSSSVLMLARNASKSLSRTLRRATRCRRVTNIGHRHLASAASTSSEDHDLASFFDQPPSFTKRFSLASPSSGLFGQPSLSSPAAFHQLAQATLLRAHLLTERIVRARESRDELLTVVKNLDRLSDMLCSVIDLAELVRNAHPDPHWVETANEAYEQVCEVMNVLNTHVGLYEVRLHSVLLNAPYRTGSNLVSFSWRAQSLKIVMNDPSITKTLSREAYQTALIFWRDFEKSGIDLPPAQRDRFVSLSSEILVLGRQFLGEASSARPPASIKSSELNGLKDYGLGSRLQQQSRFTQRDLLVYPGSLQAHMIMRSAPLEEPRRKVYLAANSSTPEQVEILEALLRARAQLATLVGSDSFAHMALGDKMAKSPGAHSHTLSLHILTSGNLSESKC